MKIKLSRYMILFILLAVVMAYFASKNQLDQTIFITIGGLMILVFMLGASEKNRIIDLQEARDIAYNFCKDEQRANRIPRGYVIFQPQEAELKSALIHSSEPVIESVGYDVIIGAELGGYQPRYYNITVSKYGNVIGISELPYLVPGIVKRVRPTISEYGGKPEYIEEVRRGEKEKKEEGK